MPASVSVLCFLCFDGAVLSISTSAEVSVLPANLFGPRRPVSTPGVFDVENYGSHTLQICFLVSVTPWTCTCWDSLKALFSVFAVLILSRDLTLALSVQHIPFWPVDIH